MIRKILSITICLCMLIFPIDVKAYDISAKSAIVIDAENGDIIFEKNSYVQMPMASTTKIMTAVVALKYGDINDSVIITDEMTGVEGSSIYLKSGEVFTLKQLLYALLLQSANDAAEAIAVHIGGTIEKFSDLMNEFAVELNLNNSHFENPHGLDSDKHYTTAYDLASLTAYALSIPEFKEIVSTYEYTIPGNDTTTQRFLTNHNKLLKTYDGAIGVKTGFTKRSGRCLVTAAERDDVTLICVTLSDPDDWNDHKQLLDSSFDQYNKVKLADVGSLKFDLPVVGGACENVTVSNADELEVTINTQKSSRIICKIFSLGSKLKISPIEKNTHLADAVFYLNGKEFARLPLYSVTSVPSL